MADGVQAGGWRWATTVRNTVLAVVGLAVVVGLAALVQAWSNEVSVATIEDAIRSWGAWGVAASAGLMVISAVTPFPAELVALANGMVYGPAWGTAITWASAMLGAYAAFGFCRVLGRPFARRMVGAKHWRKLDEWTERQGGGALFICRFIPLVPFFLLNHAAGLAGMTWWTFTWATGIGILPLTILLVVMGDRIDSLSWEWWVMLVAGGLVFWFAVLRRVQSRFRARNGRASTS